MKTFLGTIAPLALKPNEKGRVAVYFLRVKGRAFWAEQAHRFLARAHSALKKAGEAGDIFV